MISLLRRIVVPIALLVSIQPLAARICDPSQMAAGLRELLTPRIPADKSAYLKSVADAIQSRRTEIRNILLKVENTGGVDLELDLVERQLKGLPAVELYDLNHTKDLQNVAVYPATNVPLYSLVSHGVIPSAVAENVWFRTPETTRQVYLDLYNEISKALPPGTLGRLHLLTEPRDVQYDNFNNTRVMGMNRDRTRQERPPSEIVIYTGSPEAGRTILQRNIDTFRKNNRTLGDVKQVFIGLEAGVNPVIVTESARDHIAEVAHESLEPVRINCSQDCLAPDFYAVRKSVSKTYLSSLLKEIRAMRPGENADAGAGYTPLTMAKNFDRLIEYRKKYEAYLANPEATIDPATRLVSPHVFVFPASMFKDVHLQEHFGPFFTVFVYDRDEDLTAMARDPRVQNKAMYATVFGGRQATPELQEAKDAFSQTGHGVIVNRTLFENLDANFPVGGKGPDTSNIVTIVSTPGRAPLVTEGHYPSLFSHEAKRVFDETGQQPDQASTSISKETLRETLKAAKRNPRLQTELANHWSELKSPQLFDRPRGLAAIRALIQRNGLNLYVPEDLGPDYEARMREFFGVPMTFKDELKPRSSPIRGKGVVLQYAEHNTIVAALNQFRGEANPFLGWGTLHERLRDKLTEARVIQAITPDLIPRTESFAELQSSGTIGKDFEAARDRVRSELSDALSKRKKLTKAARENLRRDLMTTIDSYFSSVRKRFPEGAFIKNFGDFGTADLGTQITSFSTASRSVGDEFLRRFETSLDRVSAHKYAPKLDSKRFLTAIKENEWEMGTKFTSALLLNPDRILAQSRVEIARTEMGFPKEFRVDFLDGEPVFSKLRFGHEYYPEDAEVASQVISRFFAAAPKEFGYLSGGADVAQLANGRWVIIEMNYGGNSGTLEPRYFPIDANRYYSTLLGSSTPLLRELETAHQGGWVAERKFLETLKVAKPLFWKPDMRDDLSVVEVARWMRDQHLQEWAASNPTWESADDLQIKLQSLLGGFPDEAHEDLSNLLKGAEFYFERTLGLRELEPETEVVSTPEPKSKPAERTESRADAAARGMLYGALRRAAPKVLESIDRSPTTDKASAATVTEAPGLLKLTLPTDFATSELEPESIAARLGDELKSALELARSKIRANPSLARLELLVHTDDQPAIAQQCDTLGFTFSPEENGWILRLDLPKKH